MRSVRPETGLACARCCRCCRTRCRLRRTTWATSCTPASFAEQILKRGAPNGVEDGGGEGVSEVVERAAQRRHDPRSKRGDRRDRGEKVKQLLAMARENPTWGYTRLRGALRNTTSWSSMKRRCLPTPPWRPAASPRSHPSGGRPWPVAARPRHELARGPPGGPPRADPPASRGQPHHPARPSSW